MNNLTFNNGAYKLEKANGEVYEGVVSNLVAHFLTDTITITDRVTLVKLPIITAQSNDLQIGGQTKTFEQIKTIIETELAKGGGASTADAVSYNNSTSGLQSTNVQDAIDEVGANLGEITPKVDSLMDRADLVSVQAEKVGYKGSNVKVELDILTGRGDVYSKNIEAVAGVEISVLETKLSVNVKKGEIIIIDIIGDSLENGHFYVLSYYDKDDARISWINGQLKNISIVAPADMTAISFWVNKTRIIGTGTVEFRLTKDDIYSVSSLIKKDKSLLPIDNNNNPLQNVIRGMGAMASIRYWGVVGASFESGVSEYRNTSGTTSSKTYRDFYSVPQILARLNQVNVQNFALPGNGIKNWCLNSGEYGWGGASSAPKQAYIIVINSNDADKDKFSTYDGIGDFATDIKADYNDNPNTFCGWCAGAIQRIRSISPHAPIFITTIRKLTSIYQETIANMVAINNSVRLLPNYFDNLYVMDFAEYGMDFTDNGVKNMYMVGNHLSSLGYLVQAYHINTYIDYIMRKNASQFKYAQFILDNTITDINWSSY